MTISGRESPIGGDRRRRTTIKEEFKDWSPSDRAAIIAAVTAWEDAHSGDTIQTSPGKKSALIIPSHPINFTLILRAKYSPGAAAATRQ
jgi:predicted alpha/beta hydrolase